MKARFHTARGNAARIFCRGNNCVRFILTAPSVDATKVAISLLLAALAWRVVFVSTLQRVATNPPMRMHQLPRRTGVRTCVHVDICWQCGKICSPFDRCGLSISTQPPVQFHPAVVFDQSFFFFFPSCQHFAQLCRCLQKERESTFFFVS